LHPRAWDHTAGTRSSGGASTDNVSERFSNKAARQFHAGDLRVEVGATFPLERAADAHRTLEAGEVVGKPSSRSNERRSLSPDKAS